MKKVLHYVVIDTETMVQVGKPYKDRLRATMRVDTLNNKYGGYRYAVRCITQYVPA